ncbi:MAG: ammonia-forming cytochrome c nitrite reductase subunit c552, partial [Sporomusaceae bacterium]|nr:ammonia-forming cytochrome c nitrite reductase subunit c552 [Sporomusaceae bacterium]
MNKTQKILIAFLGVAVLFAGFVVFRIAIAKPASLINVAKISPEQKHDLAVWEKSYPLQYQSYLKMKEMAPSPTGYGGSVFPVQKSEMQPEMKTLFKGMPFSVDYSEDRGHVYTLDDLKETKRVNAASRGACVSCKTSYTDELYQEMGWGYASKPLAETLEKVGMTGLDCVTCHDPETMNLRVVNPAFNDAMTRLGVDVKNASRTDMRTYVCAQCHVEYYFVPNTFQIVYPWDKGLTAQEMYTYYQDDPNGPNGFKQDWLHPDSKTPVLKVQHPDYETYSSSAHARSGVSCADCHMPYQRDNGQKYSSHWLTSPLKNLDASCSPCHDQGTDWLLASVKSIQDKTFAMQRTAGQTIARAHESVGKAEAAGAHEAGLAQAR